ncbi:MAG: xylose isomerase, partial [Bryocella sp.]
MSHFFSEFNTIPFEGTESKNPLAYHWYDADKLVLNRPLKDHLRFAIAYWHSLGMNGSDPFGLPTLDRPWMSGADPMVAARDKADAAFDLFRILDLPFYTFHDRDIAPEGSDLKESLHNFQAMVEYLAKKMKTCNTQLLWGTANLFSHPRFMSGASTNP